MFTRPSLIWKMHEREAVVVCHLHFGHAARTPRRDGNHVHALRSLQEPGKSVPSSKIRSGDVFSPIPCKLANRDPMIHESFKFERFMNAITVLL